MQESQFRKPTPDEIKQSIQTKKLITVIITFHDAKAGERVAKGPIIEPHEITIACSINNLENKLDDTFRQVNICFDHLKQDIYRVISEAKDG